MDEQVVLVDEDGQDKIGPDGLVISRSKLEVHTDGTLHRAVSIFVFDDDSLLLQKRAAHKYHSGNLWTNTCCTHPRPGESPSDAAHRRLREEMGIVCPLHEIHQFTYRADVGNGLREHEFDHVFAGTWSGTPNPDPREVDGWRWVKAADLLAEIAARPDDFSAWLKVCLDDVLHKVEAAPVYD